VTSGGPADRPPMPVLKGLVPIPTYRDQPATPASNLSGVDLSGAPVHIPVLGTATWTLLLFLSSGCHGCGDMWEELADPVGAGLATDEGVVAVTHGPAYEDVAALGQLAPTPVAGTELVVMADEAWSAYRVQGPPFFVLVDGTADRVVTEGVAWGVSQVAEHIRSARQFQGPG